MIAKEEYYNIYFSNNFNIEYIKELFQTIFINNHIFNYTLLYAAIVAAGY